MKIKGLMFGIVLIVSCSTVQAGPLQYVSRWLGLGWSDGYHAWYGEPSVPVVSDGYHPVQVLRASPSPAWQTYPEAVSEPQLQSPSPAQPVIPEQKSDVQPSPAMPAAAHDTPYQGWRRNVGFPGRR